MSEMKVKMPVRIYDLDCETKLPDEILNLDPTIYLIYLLIDFIGLYLIQTYSHDLTTSEASLVVGALETQEPQPLLAKSEQVQMDFQVKVTFPQRWSFYKNFRTLRRKLNF